MAGAAAGLVATQNIARNDELVVVPSDSALVTTTDQMCPFPEWIDTDYWAKSPWCVGWLEGGVLLKERKVVVWVTPREFATYPLPLFQAVRLLLLCSWEEYRNIVRIDLLVSFGVHRSISPGLYK